MQTLNVELGDRSYPIFIGGDLLSDPALYEPYIAGAKVMIVSNETVAPIYLKKVKAALGKYSVDVVLLPDGEEYKTWETLNLIFDSLLEHKHSRKTTLIALGGGVVGDMTGFAAAAYQRGVDFIQVPTTLLSQVDSSVGGKTAINHPLGKNMIGAFHQPKAVIIDTKSLETLPQREVSAGIAEVIKYGLINNVEFFSWLEENIEQLKKLDEDVLAKAIAISCDCKANIVAADETEKGMRALLNLGHTFGHAIETHMGYGTWLHGEAVAAGMVMAARLSKLHGWLNESEVKRIENILRKAGLPVDPPADMSESDFMEHMKVDKKVQDGAIRLVLMQGLGQSYVTEEYDSALLANLLSS